MPRVDRQKESSTGTTKPATNEFLEAQRDWLRSRNQIWREWEGRTAEAQIDFFTAVQQAQAQAWQPVLDAQHKLAEAARRACTDPEARAAYFEAQSELGATQFAFCSGQTVRETWREAQAVWENAHEEATAAADERRHKADATHATRLKQVLADVDPKTLDANALHSMHLTAALASTR